MASRQSSLTKSLGKSGKAKGVSKNRNVWKEARSIWGKNDKPDDFRELEKKHDKEMEAYLKR